MMPMTAAAKGTKDSKMARSSGAFSRRCHTTHISPCEPIHICALFFHSFQFTPFPIFSLCFTDLFRDYATDQHPCSRSHLLRFGVVPGRQSVHTTHGGVSAPVSAQFARRSAPNSDRLWRPSTSADPFCTTIGPHPPSNLSLAADGIKFVLRQ